MTRLPEDFIAQLKQNNPIESVMSSYVSLKKSSRDYVCLCPFHGEKTASCHVNVTKQFFHCFGCHAGGDVITFIMMIENLEYIEAVKLLAERSGMRLPDNNESSDVSRLRARILEINRMAARFFNHTLTKEKAGEKGRLYFSSRQLSLQIITKYGLGYAPDEWRRLTDYLKSQGCTEEELIAANLAKIGKNGGIFDSFRDRVMFPIIDKRGNVVAFGGRILDGDGPKYLNSSDTLVFNKSKNLFSLNFAKNTKERRLILAEGYMDVIAINQAGFENVVATLGTALTPDQASMMGQYADEVVIAYDSDKAGQAATQRAINLLSNVGIKTRIIKMEGAKDPDEYIKKYGALRFKALLDKSDGAINFELEKCREGVDIESDMGKVEYLKRCIKVLSAINSPVERGLYASKLAKEQNISREAIDAEIEALQRKKRNISEKQQWNDIRTFSEKRKEDPQAVAFPREYKAERGLIAYLNLNPDSLNYLIEKLPPEHFVTEFNKKIYTAMINGMKESSDFNIMSLQSEFSTQEMGRITAILSDTEQIDINRSAADDYIRILTQYHEKQSEMSPAAGMSDDDFLNFRNRLKNKKG